MKLQISFDMTDLNQAVAIARDIASFADIIEIGTLLVYAHGIHAIEVFREALPKTTLLVDTKIVDRGKDVVTLFAKAGVDWITVMAGTNKNVIHSACSTAHDLKIKVMLDLLDAESIGQSALEAENLGADALLFHESHEDATVTFLDKWEMIQGNTQLPIFISNHIKRETIERIISVKPHGLIIGRSITAAANPAQEAEFFKAICDNN
jgi:3-hexulose-6-phosphate synthase